MHQRTEAIILKRVAYGESDWIVTFFCRSNGRLTGMAKSARASRKRFAGALEPGAIVDLRFAERRGSNMVRLEEARLLVPMHGTLKSLARIEVLSRTLALALAFLQEREANPAKFDLLRRRLIRLCEAEPESFEGVAFELRWLSLSGFAPVIGECVSCGLDAGGNEGNWRFNFDRGGFICPICSLGARGGSPLSDSALKGFMSLAEKGTSEDESHAVAAGMVLGGYVDHVLGKPIRVMSF